MPLRDVYGREAQTALAARFLLRSQRSNHWDPCLEATGCAGTGTHPSSPGCWPPLGPVPFSAVVMQHLRRLAWLCDQWPGTCSESLLEVLAAESGPLKITRCGLGAQTSCGDVYRTGRPCWRAS